MRGDRGCSTLARLLLIGAVLLSGCCVLSVHDKGDSGFLPHSGQLQHLTHHVPFDEAYIPDVDRLEEAKRTRRNVCVLPVSTKIVEEIARAQDLPKSWYEARVKDYRELALDLRSKVVDSYESFTIEDHLEWLAHEKAETLRPPFQQVACNGNSEGVKDALVWELALVELTPNIPVVSALGTVANFFFHGSALVRALGAGGVTVEGVLRDGMDMTPLMVFREHRADKIALFSVRNYTVHGHTRRVFTELSGELVALTYAPYSHDISGAWSFTFNPL